MGNKNKTISFRVNEDAFETLRDIAEERDISLSAVFRDYVDTLVAHDGQVRVIPEAELESMGDTGESFPQDRGSEEFRARARAAGTRGRSPPRAVGGANATSTTSASSLRTATKR